MTNEHGPQEGPVYSWQKRQTQGANISPGELQILLLKLEHTEARVAELENKNIALEAFMRGATIIGGDQIETINRYREALQRIADAVLDEYGTLNPDAPGFTGELAKALKVLTN